MNKFSCVWSVPALETLYQRVYDENGNSDIRLQKELEKNLEHVLDFVKQMRNLLSEYEDNQGNRVKLTEEMCNFLKSVNRKQSMLM